MSNNDIKVRAPKVDREVLLPQTLVPVELANLITFCGGEGVAAEQLRKQIVIGLQGYVRTLLEQGLSDNDIMSKASAYRPGVSASSTIVSALQGQNAAQKKQLMQAAEMLAQVLCEAVGPDEARKNEKLQLACTNAGSDVTSVMLRLKLIQDAES